MAFPLRYGWSLGLLVALGQPRAGVAQVGTTTDIITGTVTGPDSQPLAGAVVQTTSLETRMSRQRTTDAGGRYTILFPDGGGQYQVVVRYLGMAPTRVTIAREADEDRLVANVRMDVVAVSLEPVTVRARAPQRGVERPTPGSTERNLTPEAMARLPIDASDLNVLATLAPGVVAIGETDSTSAAFSVAGLRSTANNLTLDGLSFGSGSVPQDALRSTRVVTSTYDVARGQFSGGLVASTTRSGTNVPQGSFTYALRDRDLAWGGVTASPFDQGYTQNQLGGGMGGPIVSNRLFAFGALQGRWRGQALPSLLTADAASLERLGVNPDSAARFLALAGASGAPMTVPALPGDRATDNSVALLRVDWNLSDVQTLMLRFDGRWSSQDPTRVSPLALPATGGTRAQRAGGVMASLSSHFGSSIINEARGYLSFDRSDANGFLVLPEGRVQVGSSLSGSGTARGIATLAFGGNPGFPQSTQNSSREVTEELSWLSPSGGHRLKLGAYLSGARQRAVQAANQYGTFVFQSLEALAAGRPAQFTRTLAPLEQAGTAWNGALYLGDIWRAGGGLQLTYGARLETARFDGAPAYNPALDSLFDVRTDRIPSEVHLSPRVGFTWAVGGGGFGGGAAARSLGGPASTIVRGGLGEFRSPTPTGLYSAALAAPGVSNAEAQLVCVGSAVPAPDWAQYAQDPGTIPSQCVDTATAVTSTAHPNATVFDPSYTAPHAWRASLGVQRRVLGTYTVSVDASYARGRSQYGFRDLNLVATPRFTLPDEAHRPVYVPVDSIVPASGALSSQSSRVHQNFGQVIAIESDLQSEARQVTLGFGGFTARGATFQVSYTVSPARDQSSFSCCAASQGFSAPTTAGDPNVREWATSSLERRHSFLATVTYPITAALEVTAIGRLTSGVPFTPLVGSDVNGDGARNDRALVFDPATTRDTAVASGMRALLATASPRVRDCLQSQLGRVAARNSCTGPWQPSFDLQLNWRPGYFGLDRRLTLSILTVNLLGGLDEWLHGTANLRGWGFAAAPDPVLLYVRGFDPAVPRYQYAVNGRFGATAGANGGAIVPFQLAMQAHVTIGPDRTRDRLRAAFGGRRGGAEAGREGAPGGEGGPADFAARLARILPNPITAILEFRDSLGFSPSQVTALQAISDSLDVQNRAVTDSLQAAAQRAGDRPDPPVLFARIRPKLAEGREHIRQALERARTVLTADQWSRLPEALKTTGRRRPND